MATPEEHIEEIRRKKFSIGAEESNPLIEDLHQAVKNLSAELYTKDVHFLMELIQNAEDNQYVEGVDPTLEFVMTSKDITATGASATLLIFNNEKGFSGRNIESICSVGRSTKKGNRSSGYIGEKGIGFKSVFLITARPYIFSNGYQIRFNEEPCPNCGLGYIVPEWVEENQITHDIKQIHKAGGDSFPSTTIVLPLKPDKIKAVKQQLSSIHPELLLFLSKIKNLSVREVKEDSKHNTISAVSISSEINFMTRKNINAESYTLHLSAQEDVGAEKECSYYVWRQKFPVRPENRVERRMDVEDWVITLAFPNRERLHRGSTLPGVYAFLPTEMVTNFPFIIQADFVLASSRETILLDDKWNQGILDCIPFAFLDAFKALVLETQAAPVSSLPPMFKFLPIDKCSSYPKLNAVREKIKAKVVEENIVPIQTYKKQKHFYKPCEVGRLLPDFWDILTSADKQGVSLFNISSHGRYILNSSFDRNEYNDILDFLGVKPVNSEWYAKCIRSSHLVEEVSEDVYLELLLFIAENWGSRFRGSGMEKIPLIKYVASYGSVSRSSINECTQGLSVHLADQSRSCPISWFIDWNSEFRCPSNNFFIPELTQKSIQCFSKKQTLIDWLQNRVNVTTLNVSKFAKLLCDSLQNDRTLVVVYPHFLYHSFTKNYLLKWELDDLIGSMPLIDNYGQVTTSRSGVLVPAKNSKWAELMVSNPWRGQGYVELGEHYLYSCRNAGQFTANQQLLGFLKTYVGASDIPHIHPPNAGLSAVETPLTMDNAFLLLDWIRYQKRWGVPERFLCSIKEGKWLKVVNGWRPPSKSFFLDSSLGKILQSGSVLVDIPLVDLSFYGDRLNDYKEELKTVGVMFHYEEACKFIGRELMSRAASFSLSKGHVILLLEFMRYLRNSFLPLEQFINSIKEGSWLRTSKGYRSPMGSVLYDSGWQTASQISDIPFIEQSYYGDQICDYKVELQLLGAIVGFNQNYKLVVDHLKSPSCLVSLTAEALLLILECIYYLGGSSNLVNALKQTKCLKTNLGFNVPGESFLFDPIWGCMLLVFNGFPLINSKFYGAKIFSYKDQLKQIGVVVDFEEAVKAFARVFKQKASQTSLNKQHVLSFLSCRRQLKGARYKFPAEFEKTMSESKWLRTQGGKHVVPSKCILFGPEWESISPIACLPFIDDSDSGYGKDIHEYKEELKRAGVVIELKDGVKFIAAGLSFPKYPSFITPENVFSLLECIRLLVTDYNHPLEDDFKQKMSRNWLKTNAGYFAPNKCLLFGSKWKCYLNPTDGPFIDKNFYGPKIESYKKELAAIGVTVDVNKGCSIVASHLELHSEFSTIARIYKYLYDHNWKPETEAGKRIWIPSDNWNGEWVNPADCVIYDKDNLFGSRFNILEKHYEKNLLPFFAFMDVKHRPSIDDYIELWKEWESSVEKISLDECCKFWEFVLQHWSLRTEKKLADSLMKLPVRSGPNEILLMDRHDVFVADNLSLKTLFEDENVFIWYPQQSLPSLPRSKLLELYRNIGVRTISESVSKQETSLLVDFQLQQLDPRDSVIGKGLVKLILGFLACSSLKMEAEKRHEAVQGFIGLTVLETPEPVTVSYSLKLSSGNIISKEASRMVRWEKENKKFFSHKMDRTKGNTSMIKYATYFSEAISEGVLSENVDHVPALSELIKLAFVLEFEEVSVDFLMESKDLQIFLEDEEFLSSAFPSH